MTSADGLCDELGACVDSGSGAFDRAVDRGAPDAEQLGEFGGAVFAGAVHLDEMGFLSLVTTRVSVTGAARSERLAQPGPVAVGAGQAVVDVDALGLDSQGLEGIALRRQVLRSVDTRA